MILSVGLILSFLFILSLLFWIESWWNDSESSCRIFSDSLYELVFVDDEFW